ncbi:MAG: beta-ketoacyl-ACP synthase 3 [Rubripirellula sp.]|nr:beta-ketoacyl-ACP synthase 3 [Rubripirellula sp.]
MNHPTLLKIYRAMFAARQIDQVSQKIIQSGEAFFHLSGAGHEASVALTPHLVGDDWLHCHYRDKAMLLARGVKMRSFFDAMLCNDASDSRGRRMSAFFSNRELKIMSMVTPTGNGALQSVGVAAAVKHQASSPIVMCGFGDGTAQQGEVLEAIGEAARDTLPVLFMIQDNRWAISTSTEGRTFFSLPEGQADSFCGVPIRRIDGRDAVASLRQFGEIVTEMRGTRKPQIVIFEVERLDSHTNADDQTIYRSQSELSQSAKSGDPILRLETQLIDDGCDAGVLQQIRTDVEQEVAAAAAEAAQGGQPVTQPAAIRPIRADLQHPQSEKRGDELPHSPDADSPDADSANQESLTMGKAIRHVLQYQLQNDSRIFLYGQDIEDPKGDVFGITRGLSTEHPGRVRNAPLSESTILGTSIGRALAGQKPVAFIQFADFLPLGNNQLTAEMASMFWRTDGDWQVPVIVMVACGGYRPGLGPYHAQTLESTLTHTPGLDVFMPSTACDAAGMLNAAFRSDRPTLFMYPKAMLNDTSRATSADVDEQYIPIGNARKTRVGRDITFVGWGNTVTLCERAADVFAGVGVDADVIDLRSLAPWDKKMVVASAEKTSRLIVAHEDNHTCGFGGEVLATVAEESRFPVAMRRVTRADTFVPCNYLNQLELLPSFQRIVAAAAELLDFDLSWEQPDQPEEGYFDVPAIGSAPSDESVLVIEYKVQPGDHLDRGDMIAEVEASKSVFQISTPVSGTIEQLCVPEGDNIAVGKPLVRIQLDAPAAAEATTLAENPGEPILVRRREHDRLVLPSRTESRRPFDVGISSVSAVTGNRSISNEDLLGDTKAMTPADIMRLTGIETRHWAGAGENIVGMAARAARQTLEREDLSVDELDLVICSTTSPSSATPSMACQVLNELVRGNAATTMQAYDINAACSGYLYALQAGYDYLQSRPDSRVLVVTTEVLSPLLDRSDLDTAILFGDAASATVLYGESFFDLARGRLLRPILSAKGEDGSVLTVPFRDRGFIKMQGSKVFSEAVRSMVTSLQHACEHEGITTNDLNMIVPHQANQRILDAIQRRVGPTVYSNIRRFGNTSSTSIPLCLSEVLPEIHQGNRLGLCAFGGGFTFGACLVDAI